MTKYLRNYISIYIILLLGLYLIIYSVIEYIYFKPFEGTLIKGVLKETKWIRNMKSYEIEFQDSKDEIYHYSTFSIFNDSIRILDSVELVYHEDNPKEVRINAKGDLEAEKGTIYLFILFGCILIIIGTYGFFRYILKGEETPKTWRLF